MNFFEHQDEARRKTGLLVILLGAAVLTLIIGTVLAIYTVIYASSTNSNSPTISLWQFLQSPVAPWVAIVVVTVVTIGSLYKFFQINQGGYVVAEALGGRLLDNNTTDPMERKVLNVVEEMAIASGNPVPPVYVLEDNSINAFAAGLDRRTAVIGVTRGCIKLLSREELQGVIAHEFSHIHNSDMQLNMRIIAILHGILIIGLIGYYLQSSHHTGSRNKNNLAILGLLLVLIGYGGTFFGNIIKAAISREREFLADASAVQFTRNPAGIAGALKKIGGFYNGSRLASPIAAEFSHMYFANGVTQAFVNLMSTHPPLTNRIKRIEPNWLGNFPKVSDTAVEPVTNEYATIAQFAQPLSISKDENLLASIGTTTPENIEYTKVLIAGLPDNIYQASHQVIAARALLYGLLLDRDDAMRNRQLEYLQQNADPATFQELKSLMLNISKLNSEQRLTLINLAIPALKTQSAEQYKVFKRNLDALMRMDKKISLFEWSLYRITTKNIEANYVRGKLQLQDNEGSVNTLFYMMAASGKNSDFIQAVNAGRKVLKWPEIKTIDKSKLSLKNLDAAVDKLENLLPLEKPKLLKAMTAIIKLDYLVAAEEKILFRAIADTLNCPMPPI